jgi:DNA-binding transcriptional MerR regulator
MNQRELQDPTSVPISQEELNRWKASLLNLPGDTFLDLIRNFLGPIQTPYDKHSLVTRLIQFLKTPEYFHALKLITTDHEKLVINGVFHLGPRTTQELLQFLDPEDQQSKTLLAISTLVERLVLFFDETNQICINPIFKEQLKQWAIGGSLLFPSYPRDQDHPVPIPWLNDVTIQAFYGLVRDTPITMLQSLTLSKKLLLQVQKKVPTFLATLPRIEWLTQSTRILGLLVTEDEDSFDLHVVEERWAQLFQLPSWERAIYLWAGVISSSLESRESLPETPDDPGIGKPDLGLFTYDELDYFTLELTKKLACLLNDVLSCLKPDRWYPRESLVRIINSLSAEQEQPVYTILRGLEFLQVLIPSPENYWGLNPALAHLSKSTIQLPTQVSGCVVQPNGIMRFQPWVQPSTILNCIRFGSLELADFTLDFRLEKHHGFQQFRLGVTPEDLLTTLEVLSGKPLPQPFQFQVNQWYEEFTRIIPTRGILLEISPEIQTQLLHTPSLSSLGLKQLGTDVLFIPSSHLDEARVLSILKDAGFPLDGLLEPLKTYDPGFEPIKPLPSLSRGVRPITRILDTTSTSTSTTVSPDSPHQAETHRQELLDHLATLALSEDVRRELEFRIQQGTILLKRQLDPNISRPEVTQAGGLDFTGKKNLIQSAMKRKDFLEVIYHNSFDAGETKVLGYPINVTKEGSNRILVLQAPNHRPYLSIPVGSIQFVRRLRGLVFKII